VWCVCVCGVVCVCVWCGVCVGVGVCVPIVHDTITFARLY